MLAAMDPAFAEHVRYLELRLADCRARPALHRHQIAALAHLIERAGAAAGPADYLAGSGDLFELGRAEQLDRWYAAVAVQRALGDHRKASATAELYAAGRAATDHTDFAIRVAGAHAAASAAIDAIDSARAAMVQLITGLLDWRGQAVPALRDAALEHVRFYWSELARHDPAAGWSRLVGHLPYRRRIPFAGAGLAALRGWLVDAVGAAAVDGGGAADPDSADLGDAAADYAATVGANVAPAPIRDQPVPPLEQAIAGYRAAAAAAEEGPGAAEVRAAYAEVLALAAASGSTPVFMRRMVEERLAARLAAVRPIADARSALAHARPLSQPHAIFHHGALIAGLERARTATEVEYLVDWAGACLATERDWNEVLLGAALSPLRAAAGFALEPSEDHRRSVTCGAAVTLALLGAGPTAVLDSPRFADFFARALAPQVGEMVGARLGEAGLGVVQELRKLLVRRTLTWAEQAAARGEFAAIAAGPPPPDPGELRDLAVATLDQALADTPAGIAARGGEVIYWDRPVALDDLMAFLQTPPRPAPPL